MTSKKEIKKIFMNEVAFELNNVDNERFQRRKKRAENETQRII